MNNNNIPPIDTNTSSQQANPSLPPQAEETLQFWQKLTAQIQIEKVKEWIEIDDMFATPGEENKPKRSLSEIAKNLEKCVEDPEKLKTEDLSPFEAMLFNVVKSTKERIDKEDKNGEVNFPDLMGDISTNMIGSIFEHLGGLFKSVGATEEEKRSAGDLKNVLIKEIPSASHQITHALFDSPLPFNFSKVTPQTTPGELLEPMLNRLMPTLENLSAQFNVSFSNLLHVKEEKDPEEIKKTFREFLNEMLEELKDPNLCMESLQRMAEEKQTANDQALVPVQLQELMVLGDGQVLNISKKHTLDMKNPKNDFEKIMVSTVDLIERSLGNDGNIIDLEEKKVLLDTMNQVITIIYNVAGCDTAEEFGERQQRLHDAKMKADKETGSQVLEMRDREMMEALILSGVSIEQKRQTAELLKELFQLFDKNSKCKSEYNQLRGEAMMALFETIGSTLQEMGKMDPFSTKNVCDFQKRLFNRVMLKVTTKINHIKESCLSLENEIIFKVLELELNSVMKSIIRVKLHDQFERDHQTLGRIANGEISEENPYPLMEQDKLIAYLCGSQTAQLKRTLLLMQGMEVMDEDDLVMTLQLQAEQDHEDILQFANSSNRSIEIVNE